MLLSYLGAHHSDVRRRKVSFFLKVQISFVTPDNHITCKTNIVACITNCCYNDIENTGYDISVGFLLNICLSVLENGDVITYFPS